MQGQSLFRQYLTVWKYQELVKNLVIKELKTTYCASFLGLLWTMVIPAVMILIYYFAFHVIMGVRENNFLLLLMTGLFPFGYTQTAIMSSTNSIINNGDLIKKINFPRIILPMTSVLYQFFIFLMALIIFAPIEYLLRAQIGFHLFAFPGIFILHLLFTFGVSCYLAALTVFYRDIKQIMELFMLFLMWTSTAVYDIERVSEAVRPYLYLNPMTSFIGAYREIIYHGTWPSLTNLAVCFVWVGVSLTLGLSVFRSYDPSFGEEV